MTIDTATAKQLLQSKDVSELQAAVAQYKDHDDPDVSVQYQILKLLLLLQNRILQLQTAAKASTGELSVTYTGMAKSWMTMGDLEKCQGQVNKALALDSDNIDALLLQGEVQSGQAKYDQAIEFTEKAITLLQQEKRTQTELAAAYSKLATIYEMKGDFKQAVSVLQKAVNKCDSDPLHREAVVTATLHGHLGTIQEKLGHYREAVPSLTIAVQAYETCYGKDHVKTQEMEFLLEMASTVK